MERHREHDAFLSPVSAYCRSSSTQAEPRMYSARCKRMRALSYGVKIRLNYYLQGAAQGEADCEPNSPCPALGGGRPLERDHSQ